jgi:hypothetical protein
MSESIERVREQAATITSRLNRDAAFKAQVVNNPEATLVAAGLPAEAVPDFLRESPHLSSNDVSGYLECFFTCTLTKEA